MSFAQELKDFSKGFAAGSEIRYRRAAAKTIEMNLPILGPGDLEKGNVPGTFQPGGGGGVGEKSAPRVTGGSDDTGGKRPRPRSLQEAYRQGIANIESAGGNYNAVGKQTGSGDRAYGKYQIMGANIPVWTKQWLGRSLTPEQFLESPEAQDWVFDNVFGGYVKKYGLQGAARAWFGGEGAVNDPNRTDIHGKLTTGSYGRQFAAYVTNLGDLPDVSDEERQELGAGINPNAVWDDTGYYPEGKPERQAATEEPPLVEDEETGAIAESPEITAPEVDLTPQVQEAPQVGDEEEEHYAMGGVIPDDEQRFQMGGTPDPYNPNRAMTQMGGAGYTPPAQARRIALPGAGQTGTGTNSGGQNWRDWGAGGTPTQTKLRDARAQYAAAEKAKADAAAAAAAAAAAKQVQQPQRSPYMWSAQRGGPQGKETFQTFGDFANMMRTGQRPPRIQATNARYGSHAEGGMVGYARGGTVAKKPKSKTTTTSNIDWAEANRRAGKPSFEDTMKKYSRPGFSQRGDQAQEVRDRAAREMNARAGRPSSSAWADAPYVRPAAAPTPQAAPVRPAPAVRPVAPTPTPRPVTGGQPDDGQMPQVNPMGDVVAPEAGRPYPPGFDTPGEVSAAIKQDPGWAHVQKMQEQYRLRAQQPKIEVAPVDPVTGQPMETQPGMARGGVIPDAPASYARGGRVEEAGYTTSATGRRSSRKKSDPWAGLRTKTSEKVRKPSTSTVKRGAAKRKKKGTSQPGRERRQGLPKKGPIPPERPQALPERGPIPPARPGVTAAPPAPAPAPYPTPGGGQAVIPGVRGAVPGTDVPRGGSWVDANTGQPGQPPAAPPRPQQGPPAPAAPYRGHPGAPGAPVVGSGRPVIGGGRAQQGPPQPGGLMAPIGSLPRAAPQEDPRAAFIRSEKNYPRDLRQEQAVRGGPPSPPVGQTVRPARPGDYGPALTPASRGMQVFQGEEAPGEPLPERFGRGPEAEPLPERFGREPVEGGLPPEYYYEEEPETSFGGAFARGGVIPDDTDTPFRQRAGRRGGLQLRLPTKSYAKGRR